MIFPRIAALSEVSWTVPSQKSWTAFEKRLPFFFDRYKQWGVQTSSAYFDITAGITAQPGNTGLAISLRTKAPGTLLEWVQNNTTIPYRNALPITKSGIIRAQSKDSLTGAIKSSYEQLFQLHKAAGKKITLATPAAKNYPGDGALTLVNGIKANKGYSRTRDYLGFSGSDAEAVIDLGERTTLTKVEVSYLQQPSSWIYPPSAIEIHSSEDGILFTKLEVARLNAEDLTTSAMKSNELIINTKCRFIKVLVKNFGAIPAGQPGEGKPAWLFLDEISLY
jgi:hexosaminidase